MKFRLLLLLALGFVLAGCGVDPRWGPPRSGLLEPLKWQYEGLDPASSRDVGAHPVALRDSRY